jgi:hypothetical protein
MRYLVSFFFVLVDEHSNIQLLLDKRLLRLKKLMGKLLMDKERMQETRRGKNVGFWGQWSSSA